MSGKPVGKEQGWHQALTEALQQRYGAAEGMRLCLTILPGILADFAAMTRKAAGKPVREDYCIEGDGTVLTFVGRLLPSAKLPQIEEIWIGGDRIF